MPELVLSAVNVTKKYKNNDSFALESFNADFHIGEIVAVIGSNGAGKTTLFDLLSGLTKPTTGELHYGIDNSEIGWCPQREIIDWSLTVRQNIALGFELRTNGFKNLDEIDNLAQLLEIERILDRTAETLSGGELRRAQIARAIIGSPKLMILDEPTTGLDPSTTMKVFEYIQSKVSHGGVALISTHETSKFAQFCTRVIVIKNGKMLLDMSVSDFMKNAPESNDLWDAYQNYIKAGQ